MVRNTRSLTQALARWARLLRGAITAMLRRHEPEALPPPDARPVPRETQPGQSKPAKARKRKPAVRKPEVAPPARPPEAAAPNCPHCRKPMVIKTARTGRNAGDFWGCADYPKCRGIRPIFRAPSGRI